MCMPFGNSILSVSDSCVTSNIQNLGISMGFVNSNDIFKGVSDIKFGELDRLLAEIGSNRSRLKCLRNLMRMRTMRWSI